MKKVTIAIVILVVSLITFAQTAKDLVRSIDHKQLSGTWGRTFTYNLGQQDEAYSEWTFKATGTFIFQGRSNRVPFYETGKWKFKDGQLIAEILTIKNTPHEPSIRKGALIALELHRSRKGLYLIQRYGNLTWYWNKGIRYNFKKKAYFNEKGERVTTFF